MNILRGAAIVAATSVLLLGSTGSILATGDEEENREIGDYEFSSGSPDFVHGVPTNPEEAWTLAIGGRIYDNWWVALDVAEPRGTHPSYPEVGQKSGPATWRCKTCHGWDFLGSEGIYSEGSSNYTGIGGIRAAQGRSVEQIAATLRDSTHLYTTDMISDEQLGRIAAFVSRGQIDVAKYVDLETRQMIAGDINRGRGIFQTVCAACHGYDGRLLDWGDGESSNFVGTEASELPDEVLHKVLSSHPGAAMINLRAFPVDYSVDVVAYAATLPID